MDALQVVQQLRDLAAEPQNRATIVRDEGCLPGLVIFLDNDSADVVITALEALYYLAQVPSNRPLLKSELGLALSVRRLTTTRQSPEVKASAQRVHDLLFPPAGVARPLSQARSAGRGNVFLGASNRKAKLITLQVEGMRDPESRRVVEGQLLGVKGVVSFTFSLSQRRCFVRVRSDINAEVLCAAVDATGVLHAQQVVKNEHGEEVLLSFAPRAPEKENKKPSTKAPEYLPEEERPEGGDKAIERSGAVEGGGWFSSVSRFISESFYW